MYSASYRGESLKRIFGEFTCSSLAVAWGRVLLSAGECRKSRLQVGGDRSDSWAKAQRYRKMPKVSKASKVQKYRKSIEKVSKVQFRAFWCCSVFGPLRVRRVCGVGKSGRDHPETSASWAQIVRWRDTEIPTKSFHVLYSKSFWRSSDGLGLFKKIHKVSNTFNMFESLLSISLNMNVWPNTHTHKQSLFRVHSDSKTSNTQCTMPTMHHNAQTTCGVRTPLFLRSNWRQWPSLHDWDTGICKCKWQGGILQLLQYYILPFFIVFHKSEVVKSVSSSTCCKHVSNSTMLRWFNSFKVNTFHKRVLHGQKKHSLPYEGMPLDDWGA